MQIDRELDKVFRITITENEAEFICDESTMNHQRTKTMCTRIGANVLRYMQTSCISLDRIKPPFIFEI